MKPTRHNMSIPADIQALYGCDAIAEAVSFRVPDRQCGTRLLAYMRNSPRDYLLWDVTRQQRVYSWRTAAEMWDDARDRKH